MRELKDLGFKVMLWVCPFVSADSDVYEELEKKEYLCWMRQKNQPWLGGGME